MGYDVEKCIYILNAKNVELNGFTITSRRKSSWGSIYNVWIQTSENIIIKNVIMRHNFGKGNIYYIYMKESKKVEISSNVFRDTFLNNKNALLRGIQVMASTFVRI